MSSLQRAISAPPEPDQTIPRSGRIIASLRRRWRRLVGVIDTAASRVARRSGWLSSLYYLLMSRDFDREHLSVMHGNRRHAAEMTEPGISCGFLRRSIHRLEKGLLMRPRRDLFGLDYIESTMACYLAIACDAQRWLEYQPEELTWAYEVLKEYFEVTATHRKVDRLRDQFRALPVPLKERLGKYVPYLRDLSRPPTVSYDQLAQLSLRRRSVRWFLQERVPRVLIEQAMAVARQSPSACNRQPFVFRVFDDPDMAKKIGAIPGGTAGFSHNFPAVAVVIGQLRNYADERDRHVIYIDGALASMSFVYALETLGLGSCCINWPDIEAAEREMAKALRLEPDERPIMLIAFGYPDPTGLVAYSQKKPVSQICRFNDE